MVKVDIYSTKTCYYCTLAKRYFNSKGIEFTEYKVDEDRDKLEEFVEKYKTTSVPIITINDIVLKGWNEKDFEKVLQENS